MSDQPIKKRGPYTKKGSRNYINNKEFTAKLISYANYFNGIKAELLKDPENQELNNRQIKALTLKHTQMPEDLAKDLSTLARRYCSKPEFTSKPYHEELVGEAIITMYKGASNFDDNYDNGLAFMTQIAKSGIVNEIKRQKKVMEASDNMILNLGADYLEDEHIGESVRKLQEFAGERAKEREENKKTKSTFMIKNRNLHKK